MKPYSNWPAAIGFCLSIWWVAGIGHAKEARSFVHEFEVTDRITGKLDGNSYSHELLTAGRDAWSVDVRPKKITAEKTIEWRMISAVQYRGGQLYDLTPEDSNLPPGISNLPALVGRQRRSTFDSHMQVQREREPNPKQGVVLDYPGEIGLSFWALPPSGTTEWQTTCRPGFRGFDNEIQLRWKLDKESDSRMNRRFRFDQPTANKDFSVEGFVDVKDGWIVKAQYVAEFKIPTGFGFRGEGRLKSVGRSRWVSPDNAFLGKSDVVRMFERRKQYEVEVRKMYYRLLANKVYPTDRAQVTAQRKSARELSTAIKEYSEAITAKLPDETESVKSLIALSDEVLQHLKEL